MKKKLNGCIQNLYRRNHLNTFCIFCVLALKTEPELKKKGRIILTLKNNIQALNEQLDNIIKGCQQSDNRAQKELFDLFSRKMYGVCLRYGGNRSEAQDILQDGFLKIYEKIHQYEFKGSFEGWMRRIFVNTALERYRNQYKIINIQDGWREINENGYDHILDNITADELMALVQALSPKYRVVFNMYAIEGYSHKEISDLLGINEGTSKSNLSRARIILQDKVKQLYNTAMKVGI
jgi:RNA polymerase sigma factor (sigma-70 family)